MRQVNIDRGSLPFRLVGKDDRGTRFTVTQAVDGTEISSWLK